ncbi:MAG: hypothetical protein HYR73_07445 [Candidatus Eisenbacteria bacterium]|nr:hypothetical protein [Candidatus Eisenbacteria bacterium]
MQARSTWSMLLFLGLAGPVLAGCGKSNPLSTNSTPSGSTDQAQVASAMAATAAVIDDGLMEAPDPGSMTSGGPAGAAALIHPLHYWRHIEDVRRTYDFAFSDTDSTGHPTRAFVTVRKYMAGSFNIAFDATPEDTLPFDSVDVLHKPLHDLWERHVLLKRVQGLTADDQEWKVAAISGVQVTSYDPAASSDGHLAFGATKILQLRIQSASGDTVITDPLRLFWLRRVPAFEPAEDVTLTATTLTHTDVLVLVRGGMRRRFHNNGDNTYTVFWRTSAEDGIHHVGVNALSNGTLFDDQAPYDSQAWIFPYRVKPSEVAELLP